MGSSYEHYAVEFYLHYADKDLLAANYTGMKRTAPVHANLGRFRRHHAFADKSNGNVSEWQQPGRMVPGRRIPLSKDLVHTFYLWRCADLTAKAASALERERMQSLFSALAEKTRQAFHKRFYNPVTKTYDPSGSNIFALVMGVPDEVKKDVQETVREEVRAHNGHLYTGIFGTQFF